MDLKLKIGQLVNHQGFMKYFKNTSWLMGEKILRMSVGLFVGIWVARYLGPTQFGLLSYAQSFVFLFTAIATLGLDSIVVRELVRHPEKRDTLLGTAFGLKLVGAIIILPVLAIAVQLTSNDHYTNVLVFIIASATIFQSFNVIDFYCQATVQSKYIALANAFTLAISSVIKIGLILNEAPLISFAAMVVFDSIVLSCGLIYFYLKQSRIQSELHLSPKRENSSRGKLNFKFNRIMAMELLKDSWPLMLSGSVLMIQARIDQVMIKEMMGAETVGHYSVALRLIEIFGFIPLMLKNSLLPSILITKKHSVALYRTRLLNFYRLNFILFLLTAIPIFIFSTDVVVLLFGIEFESAGILLSLMVMRLFFANMGIARGAYLLAENLVRFSLITMTVGTIVNIILNYFWIAEYGARGAILATIISFFVTVFLIDLIYYKTRDNAMMQIKSIFTVYKIRVR